MSQLPAWPRRALFVSGDGSVGIGTQVPSYKLDVAGDAHVANRFTLDGNATCADPLALPWPWGFERMNKVAFSGAEEGHGDTWIVCCQQPMP